MMRVQSIEMEIEKVKLTNMTQEMDTRMLSYEQRQSSKSQRSQRTKRPNTSGSNFLDRLDSDMKRRNSIKVK